MISQLISTSDINENYIFQDLLGEGAFAEVRKAIYIGDGSEFAIKIIDKKRINSNDLRMFMNECEILLSLEHPNIIEVYEIYDNPHYFYIVMEYCSGGQLCELRNLHRCVTEAQICQIVITITDGLDFCHSKNIVHRDIKPQNILWSTCDEEAVLKIADFGFAKISGEQLMTTACGTPMFFSPEILLGQPYDNAVDYWSLGILTYILLSGKPPFNIEDELVLFQCIKANKIDFPDKEWKYISCSAKDFLLKLLETNPKKRYKASKIRMHPWINSDHSQALHYHDRTENLKRYDASLKVVRIKLLIEKTICELEDENMIDENEENMERQT